MARVRKGNKGAQQKKDPLPLNARPCFFSLHLSSILGGHKEEMQGKETRMTQLTSNSFSK